MSWPIGHTVAGSRGRLRDRPEAIVVAALIAVGAILRLLPYLEGHSLWYDETLLALNIVHRSARELLAPLDYHQGAPVGFLLLEKLNVWLFGTGEYALRLLPLVAGVASLFVFHSILRATVNPRAALIGLGLFALAGPLIHYASELKQYSSDVLVCLLVLHAALAVHDSRASSRSLLIYSAAGSAAVWFSHTAAFVVGGSGLALAGWIVSSRNWPGLVRLVAWSAIPSGSLLACYVVSLRALGGDALLASIWEPDFLPWPLWSYQAAAWILNVFFALFSGLGIYLSGLATFAFVVAWVSPTPPAQRQRLLIMLSPVAVALLAAAFHKYPFTGRFLLFLAPCLLVVIAKGVEDILQMAAGYAKAAGYAFVALLFFHSVWQYSYEVVRAPLSSGRANAEEIRPVLEHVRDQSRESDALVLYWRAERVFQYYWERWNRDPRLSKPRTLRSNEELEALELLHGPDRWNRLLADLDGLHGRVWLVFYHVSNDRGVNEEQLYHARMEERGARKLDAIVEPGASAHLYELPPVALPTAASTGTSRSRVRAARF